MAQPTDNDLSRHPDAKLLRREIDLPGEGVNERLHIGLDLLGQVERRLHAQELEQARHIVAVLLHVSVVDFLAPRTTAAEINPSTRLEGTMADFVETRHAVQRLTHRLEKRIIVGVEQDGRQARFFIGDRDRRELATGSQLKSFRRIPAARDQKLPFADRALNVCS